MSDVFKKIKGVISKNILTDEEFDYVKNSCLVREISYEGTCESDVNYYQYMVYTIDGDNSRILIERTEEDKQYDYIDDMYDSSEHMSREEVVKDLSDCFNIAVDKAHQIYAKWDYARKSSLTKFYNSAELKLRN